MELGKCSSWHALVASAAATNAVEHIPLTTPAHTVCRLTPSVPASNPQAAADLTPHTRNMAMDTDTIPNLLGDARDQAPEELQEYFIAFEDYWERKLWHELTDKLIEFYDHPDSAKQRIPFFETFIKSFANKINQLKLVTLGLNAATQYKGRTCTEERQGHG